MQMNLIPTAPLAAAQAGNAQATGAASGRVNDAQRAAMRQAAEDFEAVFLSQMLAPMFASLPTDGPMGGGHGEEMFKSMMVDEMGKAIAKGGGIGIADSVFRELIKVQEMAA